MSKIVVAGIYGSTMPGNLPQDKHTLGSLVRSLRITRRFTQRELATLAGYDPGMLGRIEQDRGVWSERAAFAFAQALSRRGKLTEPEATSFFSLSDVLEHDMRSMDDDLTARLVGMGVIDPPPPELDELEPAEPVALSDPRFRRSRALFDMLATEVGPISLEKALEGICGLLGMEFIDEPTTPSVMPRAMGVLHTEQVHADEGVVIQKYEPVPLRPPKDPLPPAQRRAGMK